MVEKKSTKKAAATKATAEKKSCGTKTCAKKAVAAKFAIDAINVGFRAGDVYEALATSKESMSIDELAKAAKISSEEVLLGMGWLLKEGKIKEDNGKVALA